MRLERELAKVPTIADVVSVTDIMTRNVTTVRAELPVDRLLELVIENRLGCVPVIDDRGRPVGMITRVDVVAQCTGRGPRPLLAGELMLPLAITLGERASVVHAAALMASEGVHHVPIVDDSGRLTGLVSTFDVVYWLASNDGFGALLGELGT
ncbi:MAG: CBS domain-containing protein [Kofleriaceae bacterium]|nr:CBS domain-containing protein [Kofleriaceae bacterium]